MNSFDKDSLAQLRVVEMCGENRWRQADTAANPDVTVKTFFDWLFEHGFFDFAVLAADRVGVLSSVLGSASRQLPGVWLDSATARKSVAEDVERVLKGFTVIFGTKATSDACQAFFTHRGYAAQNAEHNDVRDLLKGAWNSPELEDAVRVAARLGATSYCCFAHDADPVYLLTLVAG